MPLLISFVGIFFLVLYEWVFSENRQAIKWRSISAWLRQ